MLLYELALSLDKRSADVIDAAVELGYGEVTPATGLSAEQVEGLRAHFRTMAQPPPLAPLGSGLPPLPAVPTGPLVAEPGLGQPGGPVAWGPPPGVGADDPDSSRAAMPSAPATWGPPPGARDPNHTGPVFDYSDAPLAEVVDVPIGLADATLPPPPPVSPKPAETVDGEEPRFGRGQVAALAVVGVLVLGLFGFMVANTGPDHDRERAIASGETELEEEIAAKPRATTTTTEPDATTTTNPDVYAPADVEKFCQGGAGIIAFELRLSAAMIDEDMDEIHTLLAERRSLWEEDVRLLTEGSAPTDLGDIERYHDGYIEFFDALEANSTVAGAYAEVDQLEVMKAANAGHEINNQIEYLCN